MASNWISKAVRWYIYHRDAMVCCYCGKACKHYDGAMDLDTVTLDHIVSRKEIYAAATDDKEAAALIRNPKLLVVACNGCNSSKKHISLYVWCVSTGKDYAAILREIARRIA